MASHSPRERATEGHRRATEPHNKLLEEDVKKRLAAPVSERRRLLEQLTGKALSDSTIRRLLKRLKTSAKNGAWEW